MLFRSTITDFSLATFWVPETLITLKDGTLEIFATSSFEFNLIEDGNHFANLLEDETQPLLLKKVALNEYKIAFEKIQSYLKRGDIYEVNYCIPFISKVQNINLIDIYLKQRVLSPAPYSAFYKANDSYLICASPEQFIQKKGDLISCHPMKGTIKKSDDPIENARLKNQLSSSEKEKAENVMIVDLTRNDLSKIASQGSVNVRELFGVYEFPQVYQMISTVEAQLKDNTRFSSILKALFPMGSMTGAPKLNAIKIIDEVECFSRELFSGSIGYFNPAGDFNFNVVIRSILYNANSQLALVAAGGAITVHANADDEYEECLLKARMNLKLLGIDLSALPLAEQ